jgi:hypothetical protein
MKENDKSFKLTLIKESWSEETGVITEKLEKEVVVYAPTLCEAIVKAVKQNRDFTFKCLVS